MSAPEYIAPETLADALSIKCKHGAHARVVAGGTDLILRMKDRVFTPTVLLDLHEVSLNSISRRAQEQCIGSYVTLSQILASRDISTFFPALAEACRPFAGPPIRNRGTVGGNIVNASPAADLVPPLMAYDARIVLASSSGERVLALEEFFTGPGRTVMEPDEILIEVRLPLMSSDSAAAFIKLGKRRSMAISIVNVGTRLSRAEDRTVSAARIVLGAVAPTPLRAFSAESVLTGQNLSAEVINQAAQRASEEISPITDVRASADYRQRMTIVLVRRALMATWDELRGNLKMGTNE